VIIEERRDTDMGTLLSSASDRLSEVKARIAELKRQRRALLDEIKQLQQEEQQLRAAGYTARRRSRRPPEVVQAYKAAKALRRIIRRAQREGDVQTLLSIAQRAGVLE
jgi:regulator of replication initiation timing